MPKEPIRGHLHTEKAVGSRCDVVGDVGFRMKAEVCVAFPRYDGMNVAPGMALHEC